MKIILFSLIAVAIIGLMVPSVFAESTVQLYTDKKEYNMNDVIHVTGKVNFVNGKAVEIGLPDGLKVVFEVYDSSNRLIYTEIKDNVTGTFSFNIDTGFNTKLKNNDKYSFVAYYGLVNPQLRNTSYTGNVHVYLGINAIEHNTGLQTQVKENPPQSTPPPYTLPSEDWIVWVVIAIVIILAALAKKFNLFKRGSRTRYGLSESDLQNNFSRFNDEEAEELVGLLFRKKGYTVEVGIKSKSGEMKKIQDFGIDVRATINIKKYKIFIKKEKLGIQVKHWESSNVGFDDAAKTMGVADEYDKVIIISTKSDFTHQVYENKKERKNWKILELWNSEKFKDELRKYVLNSKQETKSDSGGGSGGTSGGSSGGTSGGDSNDYFRWEYCCACERKFSRFFMQKTTINAYENVPIGKYICTRCSRIYRKWDRNEDIFKESTLRNFREFPEYIPLEPSPTREKLTTDKEFDELITELEINSQTDWEFSTIEKMIRDVLFAEFSQRRHASTKTDGESEEEEEEKETKDTDTITAELRRCYEILKVPVEAPLEDIKKRYKELVLMYHPDRNPEPERKKWAEKLMKEINKAWEIIEKHFESK